MAEERSFVFDKALGNGLSPTEKIRRNTQYFKEARNVKAVESDGFRAPEAIDDPTDGTATPDWPFPQIFRTKDLLIQARETEIYSINEATGVPTRMKTYVFADPTAENADNYDFSVGTTSPTNWNVQAGGAWGADWTYAGGATDTITHVAGNTRYVEQPNGVQDIFLVSGKLYRVRVIVTAVTAGSFTVILGAAAASAAISTVGTHEFELAADSNGAIRITPTTSFDGTITSISVMEIAELAIPSGGGSWHFASFDKLFILANSAAFIFYSPRWNWRLVVDTTTRISTVCNHGDRLVMAGFRAADAHYATSFWDEIWNEWVQNSPASTVVHEDLVIGENVAFWAKSGGGYTDWPFTVEMASFGLMGATHRNAAKIYIKDQIIKGEAGFLIHPFKGAIKRVLPMADRVMLYGERGVAAAVLQQAGLGYDMVPMLNVGTPGRSTAGGDERLHRMVAETGQLWRFAPDGIENENYAHLLLPLFAEDETEILVVHDSYYGDTYIGNSNKGFLRTSTTGMTEVTKIPTSLLTSDAGLIGQIWDRAVEEDDEALNDIILETEEVDMQVPSGLKALRHVIFSITDDGDSQIYILFRNTTDPAFTSDGPFLVSNEGWVVPNCAALTFKVRLETTPGDDFHLDQIELRWILVGKHSIRGLFGAS